MYKKKRVFEWTLQKVLAVILAALLAGIFIYAIVSVAVTRTGSKPPVSGQQITVEGEYVCLPKPGDGPQTLECAFGIKTADNLYYAVEFADADNAVSEPRIGTKVRIIGIFEPQESIYISEGIIEVTSFEAL